MYVALRYFLVIARSEATKQSILSVFMLAKMDCFATLAMTAEGSGV